MQPSTLVTRIQLTTLVTRIQPSTLFTFIKPSTFEFHFQSSLLITHIQPSILVIHTFNPIQFKFVLRIFSVKLILRRDKTRPDTYAIFLGRKKLVIKGKDR